MWNLHKLSKGWNSIHVLHQWTALRVCGFLWGFGFLKLMLVVDLRGRRGWCRFIVYWKSPGLDRNDRMERRRTWGKLKLCHHWLRFFFELSSLECLNPKETISNKTFRNTDSTQGDCAVVLCAQQKPNKNKERTAVARRGIRDVPLLPKAPFLDTSGCCRRRYWDRAAAHFTRNFPVPRKVPTLFPTQELHFQSMAIPPRWRRPWNDDMGCQQRTNTFNFQPWQLRWTALMFCAHVSVNWWKFRKTMANSCKRRHLEFGMMTMTVRIIKFANRADIGKGLPLTIPLSTSFVKSVDQAPLHNDSIIHSVPVLVWVVGALIISDDPWCHLSATLLGRSVGNRQSALPSRCACR